jgi:hypothetical protein
MLPFVPHVALVQMESVQLNPVQQSAVVAHDSLSVAQLPASIVPGPLSGAPPLSGRRPASARNEYRGSWAEREECEPPQETSRSPTAPAHRTPRCLPARSNALHHSWRKYRESGS